MENTTRQNRVREALGRIYDQQPAHFREYLRRYQEDPTSRIFAPLADCYRQLGRVDEAIQVCLDGLNHHPDFAGGRVALARCYLDKKRYAEAKTELQKVVDAAPENILAHRIMGETHAALGDKEGALHSYKMALMLSPQDVALTQKVHTLEMEQRTAPEKRVEPPAASLWAPPVQPPKAAAPLAPPIPPPLPERVSEAPLPDIQGWAEELALQEKEQKITPVDREKLNGLLGFGEKEVEEEGYRTEHVSQIFSEGGQVPRTEITTETLGDLYYSQEQFDRALRIFEELQGQSPTPELARKVLSCRAKLGLDSESLARIQKIDLLKGLLKKVRQ